MSTHKRFKDKVILITGASRGIGRSTALLFAKEGAKVALNYHNSESASLKVAEVIKKSNTEVLRVKCDVSDEVQVKRMMEKTIDIFGKIDVLVNNAGICFEAPLFERTADQFRRTIDVNLLGTFLCSKYAAPHMLEQESGAIINISSTNGIDSLNPDTMDYDAAKAGVDILTRNLANALAPYVRVNSVAPGWVETDMIQDFPKEFLDKEKEKIFLRRMAKPEEIAKLILFLASDDASFINGSIVKIDGGYG
jgi:3-oxoacyl-[acyl-carrier protein] reductase